jgi:hypothetical protein
MTSKECRHGIAVFISQVAGVEFDNFIHIAADELTFWLHAQNQKQIKIGKAPFFERLTINRLDHLFSQFGTSEFTTPVWNAQAISRRVTLAAMSKISGEIGATSD